MKAVRRLRRATTGTLVTRVDQLIPGEVLEASIHFDRNAVGGRTVPAAEQVNAGGCVSLAGCGVDGLCVVSGLWCRWTVCRWWTDGVYVDGCGLMCCLLLVGCVVNGLCGASGLSALIAWAEYAGCSWIGYVQIQCGSMCGSTAIGLACLIE